MASKLNPYLQFKDNAREAMTYYQDVFGGDLVVNTFSEYGGDGDGVMHSQLEAPNGFTLMASDTPEGMPEPSPAATSRSASAATTTTTCAATGTSSPTAAR